MKRKIIIKLSLLLCSMLLLTNATAQKKSKRESKEQQTVKEVIKSDISGTFRGEPVYTVVDEPCSFTGGSGALMKYISKNIQYPEVRCCRGIQGRVIVTFIIAKDGSVQQAKVIRSIDPDYCDKEALRIVKGMPKWKASKLKGKPVHQRFTLPIQFRLM